METDPVAHVVLALGVLLLAARLAGEVATRLGQPQVLGELVAGMLLAAVPGTTFFRDLATEPVVDALGRLGALILLFDAGLALNVREVLRVGAAAARVAILGTVGTFACGWLALWLIIPGSPAPARAFLAASLTATSVGISARVLKDLGREKTIEARTVLSAAVLDDVIALLVLSVTTGWLTAGMAGTSDLLGLGATVLKTSAFLVSGVVLGMLVAPHLFHATARIRTKSALLVVGLVFCFVLSWAADRIGLSPIVGAFAAGLVLEEAHWKEFTARGDRGLDQELSPIAAFLVPLFFVLLGLRTDLSAFQASSALLLTAALTVAAIVGKLAAGLGAARGTNRLAIAFGMMPRGEVSLIFASLGLSMHALGKPHYSALVAMVVVTTLVTPFGLTRSFRRAGVET